MMNVFRCVLVWSLISLSFFCELTFAHDRALRDAERAYAAKKNIKTAQDLCAALDRAGDYAALLDFILSYVQHDFLEQMKRGASPQTSVNIFQDYGVYAELLIGSERTFLRFYIVGDILDRSLYELIRSKNRQVLEWIGLLPVSQKNPLHSTRRQIFIQAKTMGKVLQSGLDDEGNSFSQLRIWMLERGQERERVRWFSGDQDNTIIHLLQNYSIEETMAKLDEILDSANSPRTSLEIFLREERRQPHLNIFPEFLRILGYSWNSIARKWDKSVETPAQLSDCFHDDLAIVSTLTDLSCHIGPQENKFSEVSEAATECNQALSPSPTFWQRIKRLFRNPTPSGVSGGN